MACGAAGLGRQVFGADPGANWVDAPEPFDYRTASSGRRLAGLGTGAGSSRRGRRPRPRHRCRHNKPLRPNVGRARRAAACKCRIIEMRRVGDVSWRRFRSQKARPMTNKPQQDRGLVPRERPIEGVRARAPVRGPPRWQRRRPRFGSPSRDGRPRALAPQRAAARAVVAASRSGTPPPKKNKTKKKKVWLQRGEPTDGTLKQRWSRERQSPRRCVQTRRRGRRHAGAGSDLSRPKVP